MEKSMLLFTLACLSFASCKKDIVPEDDGAYTGKVKSINGSAWSFKYTDDGLLAEYSYRMSGTNILSTAELTWESGQVTCNDGPGYTYIRPRNAAGYAEPGNNDQQTGNNWTYDLDNRVTSLNGISYFWNNGNLDSLKLGSSVSIFSYNSTLESRDFGAGFVPLLTNFPQYNLRMTNLPEQVLQLDGLRDTISIRRYTYELDSLNRVKVESETTTGNGQTQQTARWEYEYWD